MLLGMLEIRLDDMRLPLKKLPMLKSRFIPQYHKRERINLFEHKKVRGYFPVYGPNQKATDTVVTVSGILLKCFVIRHNLNFIAVF